MSIDTAWKRLERRHAKRFTGGKRLWRPDYGESAPDGESPTECWDTKAYARFSVITLYEKAERRYREWTGGRNFHLCLYGTEQRGAGDFVLVRAERYAELVEIEREVKGVR